MRARFLAVTALIAGMSAIPAFAQGFGEDIPLNLAVQRIVPESSNVVLADGVDGSVRVSWSETNSWREALEEAVSGAGYIVTVSGSDVTITRAGAVVEREAVAEAEPAPRPAPSTAAPRPASRPQASQPAASPRPAPSTRPAQQRVEMPVVSSAGFVLIPQREQSEDGWTDYDAKGSPRAQEQESAPAAPEWIVQAGDDLHAVLRDWAEQGGWHLVWESEYRYTLTSAARFQGDFVSATQELLRAMQNERPVITADFFQGNKVLVIGNNSLDVVN